MNDRKKCFGCEKKFYPDVLFKVKDRDLCNSCYRQVIYCKHDVPIGMSCNDCGKYKMEDSKANFSKLALANKLELLD